MRTEQEIIDRIHDEVLRLSQDKGHMASITRGWLDALEWVLGRDG
jgi:hypothetical protein